jgi:hypothetical protein
MERTTSGFPGCSTLLPLPEGEVPTSLLLVPRKREILASVFDSGRERLMFGMECEPVARGLEVSDIAGHRADRSGVLRYRLHRVTVLHFA